MIVDKNSPAPGKVNYMNHNPSLGESSTDFFDSFDYSLFINALDLGSSNNMRYTGYVHPESTKDTDVGKHLYHASLPDGLAKLANNYFSTPGTRNHNHKSALNRYTPSTMSPISEPNNHCNKLFINLEDFCIRTGSFSELVRDNYDLFKINATSPEQFELIRISPKNHDFPPERIATKNKALQKTDDSNVQDNKHPHTCKPCVFYLEKGCLSGDDCQFCHEWHAPKRKKVIREQKNLVVLIKPNGKISYLRLKSQELQNIL